MKHIFVFTALICLLTYSVSAQELYETYNIAGYHMFGKLVKIENSGRIMKSITIRVEKNNFFDYYVDYIDGKWRKLKINDDFDFTFEVWVGNVTEPTKFNPSNFWQTVKKGTMLGVKFDNQYLLTEEDGYTLLEQRDGYNQNAVQVDIIEDQTKYRLENDPNYLYEEDKVQSKPRFNNSNEWAKFFTRNINSSIPIDNNAPAGKYTVKISFIVDKTGFISNMKIDNDPGFGTKQEVERLINRFPYTNITPASIHGTNVKCIVRKEVTFYVLN